MIKSRANLTVGIIGLGYFSQFHLSAWHERTDVSIVGLCDSDADARANASAVTGAPAYPDVATLVAATTPDIVDVITPPGSHDAVIRAVLAPGRTIICQKPFCRDSAQADALIQAADEIGARIVIHENFRFQPWHRTIKAFLDAGRMGQVYQIRFALRPGDGRGRDAYLARQPIFQTMPRLLIHETGVHFVDLFRWLLGDITSVYADLRQLNPAIAGEDAGTLMLTHTSGARSVFDGNRLADHITDNPRRTMGEMEIEGEAGRLSLDGTGRVWFRAFDHPDVEEIAVTEPVDDHSFGGGCVAALIGHVVDGLVTGAEIENHASEYRHVMQVVEAAYQSHAQGRRLEINA